MRKRAVPVGIILVLAIILIAGLYNELEVTAYSIRSEKINAPLRIVFVSDLHSCYYGENAETLLAAVDAQNPDLILLGGDIFDDVLDTQNTEAFLQGVGAKYPCCYVTGNHEYWSGPDKFAAQMQILDAHHVVRLNDQAITLEINGQQLNLCGLNDPVSYNYAQPGEALPSFGEKVNAVSGISENGFLTILLSHRPERFDLYSSAPFDLVLAGHAHGGQWRLPWLLNGLYAPNQGFFPKLAGGIYEKDGTQMVVSRGLARESTRIPRFFNRPELVVIDVRPE